ncbi:MFS transporter [Sphingobacterium corticibacter]|uniref:MFS transporter n=1 Tax=Sphingobacterium corticibacter TaxID=2171749 RepID=UPI001A9C4DA6|nr:MFS transporter [Sphingobacterium corticibacter]
MDIQTLQKDNPKTIRSWAMFDWANSAYNLVITSTIFPAYYTAITYTEEFGDVVYFFGYPIVNTALSNFALSISYLIMAFALPFISAYADVRGRKKYFMKFFTYLGALACMGLFFFRLETLELSIFLYAFAAAGYIGGLAFNNSYLPLIASVEQQDRVSAQGFAYGYVGCVTLQIICFVFVLKPEWFGITDASLPARLSFFLVGLWWLGFSQIPFHRLPESRPSAMPSGWTIGQKVRQEFGSVWQRIQEIPAIKRFLFPYFFYSMGVQTVMIVATAFGMKEIGLEMSELIAAILLIQLIAIGGAYLMSKLAKPLGNTMVLIGVVCVWIFICVAAFYIQTKIEFYILAMLVGAMMGGIQSLSRSTYSKLLPSNIEDTTSFFSFYDVTEKVAIVLGLFSFAIIEQVSHNIRYSALFMSVFFIVGLILLISLYRFESKATKNTHA